MTMAKKKEYTPEIIPHPGLTLAEKLQELRMGPKEFAVRTGKPEKTIIAVMSGKSSITPDMAILFENVLKIPAHYWTNHQRAFDEAMARSKRKVILAQAEKWCRQFPIVQMVKLGWIPKASHAANGVEDLLNFFGFSDHYAWENYYLRQQLRVAFRISLKKTTDPYAISAWLRKGDLQAAEISTSDFSEKKFKEALEKIQKQMNNAPKDESALQHDCLKAGVKLIFTPSLPNAPIIGATRWMNDVPVIQIDSKHLKSRDFWFTFFHEAGHILLHGKKDVFLENIQYSELDKIKELEADDFAVRYVYNA
jgi:addiction module HigA family antidote